MTLFSLDTNGGRTTFDGALLSILRLNRRDNKLTAPHLLEQRRESERAVQVSDYYAGPRPTTRQGRELIDRATSGDSSGIAAICQEAGAGD